MINGASKAQGRIKQTYPFYSAFYHFRLFLVSLEKLLWDLSDQYISLKVLSKFISPICCMILSFWKLIGRPIDLSLFSKYPISLSTQMRFLFEELLNQNAFSKLLMIRLIYHGCKAKMHLNTLPLHKKISTMDAVKDLIACNWGAIREKHLVFFKIHGELNQWPVE